jgi:hypothetical protein
MKVKEASSNIDCYWEILIEEYKLRTEEESEEELPTRLSSSGEENECLENYYFTEEIFGWILCIRCKQMDA